MGVGKFLAPISVIQSLQNLGRYISLVMLSTWLNFEEILPEFFLANFSIKF